MLEMCIRDRFEAKALKAAKPVAKGLPASPGAASGKIYFTAEDALAAKERGEKIVLCRQETSPEDIEGMHVSEGILTARGGRTSHAAVVARGMGTCCVAGCGEVVISCLLYTSHGDGMVTYFYRMAQMQGPVEDESVFQYPSIKPQTKEAGVLLSLIHI